MNALAVVGLATLLSRKLAVVYLDVVFLGQPAQRLGVGHLFVLHDKAHGVAAFAAGKAMAIAFGRRHHERWCLLVVERAQPLVVDTSFAQGDKLGYHIHDVGSIHNLIYRCLVYHIVFSRCCKINHK